jgi:hypothetical protein
VGGSREGAWTEPNIEYSHSSATRKKAVPQKKEGCFVLPKYPLPVSSTSQQIQALTSKMKKETGPLRLFLLYVIQYINNEKIMRRLHVFSMKKYKRKLILLLHPMKRGNWR